MKMTLCLQPRIFTRLLVLFFSSLLSACGGDSDFNGENSMVESGLISEFYLRDNLQQEENDFLQGESIELYLKLTNNSEEAQTLKFNSGQQYNFYIRDTDDNEVWNWSSNQLFTQATTEITLNIGQSIEFKESWDQRLLINDSPLISTGEYLAYGQVIGLEASVFTLNIQ